MGWVERLIHGDRAGTGPWTVPGPLLERATSAFPPETSDPPGMPVALEDIIAADIAQRMADFTLDDALKMPPVIRAVQLICSTIAQFQPVAYRGGVPLAPELQPAVLGQPMPFGSRYQFTYQTIYSQLAMAGSARTGGDAYWLIGDRGVDGMPLSLVVLDPAEVFIEWDRKRFQPVYTWRERTMNAGDPRSPDTNLVHLTIGRPPGQLHGRSPLVSGLPALAVVDAAETYAYGYFGTSGIPSVIIKAAGKGSPEEASRLKKMWLAAHDTAAPTPAVLFQGGTGGVLDVDIPNVDAQRAQLQESRQYGTTVTAVLLGIPAPLLHVMTSGATITYNNAGGALDEFVRATGQPVYLAPLEGYLSSMVPRTQTVRYDTNELNRIDIAGRIGVYSEAIAARIMAPTEARLLEGWPTDGELESTPTLAATPALPAFSMEVPARV